MQNIFFLLSSLLPRGRNLFPGRIFFFSSSSGEWARKEPISLVIDKSRTLFSMILHPRAFVGCVHACSADKFAGFFSFWPFWAGTKRALQSSNKKCNWATCSRYDAEMEPFSVASHSYALSRHFSLTAGEKWDVHILLISPQSFVGLFFLSFASHIDFYSLLQCDQQTSQLLPKAHRSGKSWVRSVGKLKMEN